MSLSSTNLVYAVSLVAHIGGGLALSAIRVKPPPEVIAVEIHDVAKPPPKPEPPPPEPVVEQKAARPKPAAAEKAPAPAPAAPEFGLVLSSGIDGPGGMAVPVGPAPEPVQKQVAKKLAPKPETGGCADGEETKAKALSMPRPAYTDEARAAAIEGKVRVELTIDETGAVTNATIKEGLGHGLDDAALAAVRGAKFSPATRCGKSVASTFVVAVRFAL